MGATQSLSAVLVGRAFDTVLAGVGICRADRGRVLLVVAAYVGFGLFDIVNSLVIRVLAQRVERDAVGVNSISACSARARPFMAPLSGLAT